MTLMILALGCSNYNVVGTRDADSGGVADWASDDTGWGGEDRDTGDGFGSEDDADDFLKLEPAATDAYVFVVNSTRNTVSRISVPQLEVMTVEVGINPTVAVTTSDYTKAVTFNEGSDDVSIIDAETLEVMTVGVRDNFNAMELSPDGRWVICFHDGDSEQSTGSDGGLQSFNEISIVDTVTGEHSPMAVGFNPRQIEFTQDSTTALIVSDAFVALIDLTAEKLKPVMVELSEDLIDPPKAEEVVVAPSGEYAFVRQFGSNHLLVLDLLTQEVTRVPVGSVPTDLDLSPDGTKAAVVARGSHELYVFDVDDPFAAAEVFDLPQEELLGSLQFSPDASKAILYTTAAPIGRFTTWDVESDEFTIRALEKPVKGVRVSPDGGTLTIFHPKTNSEDADPNSVFNDKDALTMVNLDDFRSNALLLPKEPSAFVNSHDGQFGYFIMEGSPFLEVLLYDSLLYDEVRLKSNPVHVGVLPESTYAYVNQEHDLGRLSFYEPESGVVKTITGFELNSGIEH